MSNKSKEPQGDDTKEAKNKGPTKEEMQTQLLCAIFEVEDNSYFFIGSNTKASYITWCDDKGKIATDVIGGDLFKAKILMVCCQVWDKMYSPHYINNIVYRFNAIALRSEVEKEIFSRIAKVGDLVIYNLNNYAQEFVAVSPSKVAILTVQDLVDEDFAFSINDCMAEQVRPKETEDTDLFGRLAKYINLDQKSQILLIVTIISWFIPNVPKAIILLNGEAGTGKTVLSSIIQDIVDPTTHNVLAIPDNREDMGVALSCHYLLTVDNISELSKGTSDLLCQASTGGSVISRTKFTNFEASIVSFKNCVILNGITVENAKPDLLDRTIKLEMEQLTGTYDSVEEILDSFRAELPEIMYLIFHVLQKAMAIHKNLDKKVKTRMFDYFQWGRAISIAMFGSEEEFINAYLENKGVVIESIINSDPFACSLKMYLDAVGEFPHDSNPTELYKDLISIADKNNLNKQSIGWPKGAQEMSSLIKRLQPAFRAVGYEFDIDSNNKKNGKRYIRIGKIDINK